MWDWTMTREADSFLFASSDFGLEHLGDLLLPELLKDHPELGSLKGKNLCSRLRELSLNTSWDAQQRQSMETYLRSLARQAMKIKGSNVWLRSEAGDFFPDR
jgi:hypothetical protein